MATKKTKTTTPKKARTAARRTAPRSPLTRERVVAAALALVDDEGVEGLSMRTVAARLGVEAMSLYRHVANKEDLLLAVADLVLSEIEVPPPGTPWRAAMERRALSAREVFLRHPSAAIVVESCATMTPSRLAYGDAIAGLLVADGFAPPLAYRAFMLLDSYVYGYTMQELSWPHPTSNDEPPVAITVPLERFPHFGAIMQAAMAKVAVQGFSAAYDEEFRFGLALVLDALERSLVAQQRTADAPGAQGDE